MLPQREKLERSATERLDESRDRPVGHRAGGRQAAIERQALPDPPEQQPFKFKSADGHPIETGKTILAYCSWKRTLLVAIQEDGATPGVTYSTPATALTQRNFDAALCFWTAATARGW